MKVGDVICAADFHDLCPGLCWEIVPDFVAKLANGIWAKLGSSSPSLITLSFLFFLPMPLPYFYSPFFHNLPQVSLLPVPPFPRPSLSFHGGHTPLVQLWEPKVLKLPQWVWVEPSHQIVWRALWPKTECTSIIIFFTWCKLHRPRTGIEASDSANWTSLYSHNTFQIQAMHTSSQCRLGTS